MPSPGSHSKAGAHPQMRIWAGALGLKVRLLESQAYKHWAEEKLKEEMVVPVDP